MNKSIKCDIPGFQITIEPGLYDKRGGVYKVVFKDGLYYIGSSGNLRNRVINHLSSIRKGFPEGKPLCEMKGYSGVVKFVLVAYVDDKAERLTLEYKIWAGPSKKRINTTAPGRFTGLDNRYKKIIR